MPDQPHNLFTLLTSLWAQVLATAALIVWLIRGEASTKANAAEIRRLWRQREEDLRLHKEARDTTNDLLDEVRHDIKTLLSRRD